MTHLIYEADALATPPNLGASERAYRAYHRSCVRVAQDPHRQFRSGKRDQAYREYQRLFAAQEQLRKEYYGACVISDALSRLPKLISISMSLCYTYKSPTTYFCEAFKASLHRPYGAYGHGQPNGVPQLRSLLLGCHHTGRQLTKLIIGDINWQFLRDGADNTNMIKQSLRHLRVLDLTISTGHSHGEEESGPEMSRYREYLTNNALCDFVKAAPELESLSIAFDSFTPDGTTQLKHIVRDHRWKNLKRVEFKRIDATQADFAAFFSRHASTLKYLGLCGIRLIEQGEWVSTLENIQKTLSLSSASIRVSLFGEHPLQYWRLGVEFCEDDGDEDDQRNKIGNAISKFLVHGGSCPLRDEGEFPNQVFGY